MKQTILTALICATFFINATTHAQGNQQERDRVQEPSPGRIETVTQTQDRTRTQDPATTTPAQAQVREQDQIRQVASEETEPGQVRTLNQDRAQLENPEQLRQFIREQEQQQTQTQERNRNSATQTPRASEQLRTRSEVATQAILSSQNLLGQNGQRMAEIAREVNQTNINLEQRVQVLEKRSWLRNFLFGQDRDVANRIQLEAKQNRVRLQEMQQLTINCEDCDQEVKQMIQEQIQLMEQEQQRVETEAIKAREKRGVFGFLFGWLR